MKKQVTIFKNEQFGQVRTISEGSNVLFCGKDVAVALGYSNTKDAIARHCRLKGVVKRDTLTNGGKQELVFIDEGNLYRLITHSKLPAAEQFESWVFDEVLPAIRKTGGYTAKHSDDALKAQRVETARMNAETRRAQSLMKIAEATQTAYKQVLHAYAANILAGKPILPLPEVNERTYSAGEIADILGTTANKIGRLANLHGLKTEKYGKWFYDKAKTADKQVETFRYYESAIEVFRALLNTEAAA